MDHLPPRGAKRECTLFQVARHSEKSSRQTADVIGMIMIVRTMIAVKTLLADGVPPKIGMKPSQR